MYDRRQKNSVHETSEDMGVKQDTMFRDRSSPGLRVLSIESLFGKSSKSIAPVLKCDSKTGGNKFVRL